MRKFSSLWMLAALGLAGCSDRAALTQPEAGDGPDLSVASGIAPAPAGGVIMYEVTIENLTTSQPFSPGVIVTHPRGHRIFHRGRPASEGIRLIAENGDPSVAVTELSALPWVHKVDATTAPVHRIGGPGPNTLTMKIGASVDATHLSLAVMLICTNDGFAGVNNVRLPRGHRSVMRPVLAYDAGTERNDELFTSIVDPCGAIGPVGAAPDGQNDRTATPDGVVRHHRGIHGGGDLSPSEHGWREPVAKVTVRRIPMERVYKVTIENLTESQPFSPGVVATHVARQRLFQRGEAASEGIRLIAENGDPTTAEADFSAAPGVHDVIATAAPIHRVGGPGPNSLSVEVSALGRANFLSLSVMLICTNDGFAGLSGVWLPVGWEPRTYWARGYDSGTERNDELYTSIVDPCGGIGPVAAAPDGENNRTPTRGVVRLHEGIQGVGDLGPDAHGWENPVAKVVVQRIK